MRIRVCFHDKCFDGACSAAVFTRFYHTCINKDAEVDYRGMVHRAGKLFDAGVFDGDENAIVDFKYSPSERLTWWFDHHQSAFLTESDAQHFKNDKSGKKFYGPDYKSCTKFIAHVGASKFGFHPTDLDELIKWADIIDGAQYPDTKTAVEMKHPATQLTLVIEGSKAADFVPKLIPELASKPLAEVAALSHIKELFSELYEHHLDSIDIIRGAANLEGGVVFFDVSAEGLEGFNKFIPYYLFPDAVYSVAVSCSAERSKIAVGSNPWNSAPKNANLATICERFGGGGHAKVAAISLPPTDLARTRQVAQEIVEELRASLRQ